ncbi:MAG: hypothetical protein HKL85_09220, partial [Acidimicrobiaceae bacterium]|nr:hypothetical protein [Acidimicrobiaceae bacterium]
MACTGLSALDPICQVATSIGHLGASVTNSVFSSVASAFATTADSAINWLWSQMTSATAISFSGPAFALDLGIVSAIAAVVCVGLFVIQLATSALKRDGSGIARALRGLVVASLGCAITLASLDLLLAGVDQLCSAVVRITTGGSLATLGAKIIDPAMFTGLLVGPGAILILSLIAIVAVAVVWFALVVRKMLIIVTAIFAPLAFAGGVADLSRGWVRKWLEGMLALVFSKLILILIFVIGLGVLGGMGSPENAVGLSRITGDVTGLLILLVAGLSPWMALKLVHFTGEHMATVAGSASHVTSGASRVISAPQKVASMRSTASSFATPPHRPSAAPGRGTQSASSTPRAGTPGDAVAATAVLAGAAVARGTTHADKSSSERSTTSSADASATNTVSHSRQSSVATPAQGVDKESTGVPVTNTATGAIAGPATYETRRVDGSKVSTAPARPSNPAGGRVSLLGSTSGRVPSGYPSTPSDRVPSDGSALMSPTSRDATNGTSHASAAHVPSAAHPVSSLNDGVTPVLNSAATT